MGLAAIGAGAALAMGGASAIGAVGTAIAAGTLATVSIGTVFTAVATVGAVVGAVGAVTGVSELKTAGMVLGGIGGIGSLASAVGAFGESATVGSIFGGGAGEAAGGGDFIGATGNSLINSGAGEAAGGGDFIGSSLDGATGQISSQSSDLDIIGTAAKIGGGVPNLPDPSALAGAKTDAVQQKLVDGSKTAPLAKQATSVDDNFAGDADVPTGVVPKASNAGTNVTGTVNGPPATAKMGDEWTNPDTGANFAYDGKQWTAKPSFWGSNTGAMMGMGVLQSAGSFLSGAFDEVKPAQAAAYNAQAAANNAQAALANKELSNMNGRIPTARRLSVTGQTSLINPGRAA